MAIAKVSKQALVDFKNDIEKILQAKLELQDRLSEFEDSIQKVNDEIDKYTDLQYKCQEIMGILNDKYQALITKKEQLESKKQNLEKQIDTLKNKISELNSKINELSKNLRKSAGSLAMANQQLIIAQGKKLIAEQKLIKCRVEIVKVEEKIKKVQHLQHQTTQKQNEIRTMLNKLIEEKEKMLDVYNQIKENLIDLERMSNHASECVAKSDIYLSRYLNISISSVSYSSPSVVTLRRGLNLKYAGMRYDYANSCDSKNEVLLASQIQYFRTKYPDVFFSKLDSFGNTYPDFSKYSIFKYAALPVTKENLALGTCLIGDSKSGSADFKKFRMAMESQGYSKQDIAKKLSRYTIHHHEDGQTMLLIPRDLHQACKHNGGAERIRLLTAMIGG